jgi:hypothetical protein
VAASASKKRGTRSMTERDDRLPAMTERDDRPPAGNHHHQQNRSDHWIGAFDTTNPAYGLRHPIFGWRNDRTRTRTGGRSQ